MCIYIYVCCRNPSSKNGDSLSVSEPLQTRYAVCFENTVAIDHRWSCRAPGLMGLVTVS